MSTKVLDDKKLKDPEKRVIVKECFVKEHGEDRARMRKYGEEVTVSGLGKAELDYRGLAVTPEEFKKLPKKKAAVAASSEEKAE